MDAAEPSMSPRVQIRLLVRRLLHEGTWPCQTLLASCIASVRELQSGFVLLLYTAVAYFECQSAGGILCLSPASPLQGVRPSQGCVASLLCTIPGCVPLQDIAGSAQLQTDRQLTQGDPSVSLPDHVYQHMTTEAGGGDEHYQTVRDTCMHC